MNVLLISRPGITLLRSLRESETAWDAIRFYDPKQLDVGVLIPVSTLSGAISLTSDLRFFLRKFTADHLFQRKDGVCYSAALTKSRYLTREISISETWPYRLMYWIDTAGLFLRVRKDQFSSAGFFTELYPLSGEAEEDLQTVSLNPQNPVQDDIHIPAGYLLEVWCTRQEYDIAGERTSGSGKDHPRVLQ